MHLNIIAAQLNLTVGDTAGNRNLIEQSIQVARDELGGDIIVFPELAITGYPPEDLLLRQSYLDEVEHAMEQLVSHADGITLVIGHPQQTPLGLCNAVTVMQDKEWLITYQKQCLPNTQVFDEKRYFEPGRDPACFTLKGISIGLLICEDIWHSEPVQAVKSLNTDLVLAINASPFSSDKMASRHSLLKAQARSLEQPIVYVNCVGGQDELIFDGGSFAVDAQGEVVSQAPVFEETLWPIQGVFENRQLTLPTQQITPLPDAAESIYKAIVLGLRDYYHKNKFAGVVLGLSGGIDSALTLAIAVDALGAEHVEALLMPSRYTSELSNDLAIEQAKSLGVRYDILPIEPAYEAFLNILGHRFQDPDPGITQQNIQARCRGVLAMAVSNKTGSLLLTTGNKSEYAVGYATLYGDMCGGFAPLKDLSKTWVYQLCETLNGINPVIPQAVIDRPPTAELAPNQRDSDSLPEYHILDQILACYMEQGQSVDQIVEAGFDRATVEKVTGLLLKNEYKRRQSAPGPKVTNKAFGRDRRYPITSGFLGKV
jgi:NAD+ synthase (glutamine-hydrolysing)